MIGGMDEPSLAPYTQEVADGVFAYVQPDGSWWLNNTGIVTGSTVVAVDASSTERRTRALLEETRRLTRSPIRTLVNTHHHGDHTNGNCLYDEAAVIGHRRCRDGVAAQVIGGLDAVFGSVDWGELTIRPPEVVFDDRADVFAGDRLVELHYIGTPAHTVGDAVAWLPDERVLFAGDLVFTGGTPFMLMGSVAGTLDALTALRGFDATVVVPGHGPVGDLSALDDVERYVRFVLDLAVRAVDAGLSPLEAAREAELGEFAEWHDRERIVGNLHRAMAELRGLPRGGAVDVMGAFADMLDYNGGPLRCLA
jgi:cyclase